MRVVGEAETPQACIAGILSTRPDVVVLDVQLEGGQGLEVLRAVRCAAPQVAFVVFSNNAGPAYRKRYLARRRRVLPRQVHRVRPAGRRRPCRGGSTAVPVISQPADAMTTAALASRTVTIHPLPTQRQPAAVTPLKTQCSTCHLRDLCLPCGLTGSETESLDRLMFGRRKIAAGQSLYRAGDRFQFVYAVRTGTFKTSLPVADGREQVSGFHMAGELLGLDGLANGVHASSATALEDTEVCAIPYTHLSELAAPERQRADGAGAPDEPRDRARAQPDGAAGQHERGGAARRVPAEPVAALKARGYSPSEFHLRMSRAEIGSYLGMKLETVSRTFSAFQQQRLLEVDKKHVRINDIEGLTRAFESRVH